MRKRLRAGRGRRRTAGPSVGLAGSDRFLAGLLAGKPRGDERGRMRSASQAGRSGEAVSGYQASVEAQALEKKHPPAEVGIAG